MRSPKLTIILCLLALATTAALALYQLGYPLRAGNDGAFYIQGARSLAAGEGYLRWAGEEKAPLIDWPPIYSATLAVLLRAGLDVVPAIKLINFVSTLVFVGLWVVLLRRHLARDLLFLFGVVLTLSFWGLWYFNGTLASESLSLAILALFLLVAFEALGREDRAGPMLAAGLLVAFLALTRYACVPFVLGSGLFFLLETRSRPAATRWRELAAFALPPALLLGSWFLYSKLATDAFTFLEDYPETETHYDFEGFLFYANRLAVNGLGVPERFTDWAWLAFLPLLAAFATVRTRKLAFLASNVLAYVALIFYMYFEYDSSAKRYIFFLVPILQLALLLAHRELARYRPLRVHPWRAAVAVSVAGLLALYFAVSPRRADERIRQSERRTSDTVAGLDVTELSLPLDFLPRVARAVDDEDLLTSNYARYVSAFLDRPAHQLTRLDDLERILADPRTRDRQVYLLLVKVEASDLGEYPVIDWRDFLAALDGYRVVLDDEAATLLEVEGGLAPTLRQHP